MNKLEKTKQAELRKMSDARLVSKLTQSGCSLESVESMDRMAMLDKWAEVVLAGKDVSVNLGGATAASASVSGYDIELERRRLDFQMKQWEQEMVERKSQRDLDAQRVEDERAEREAQRDLEMKRLDEEKEHRKELIALQQRQITLMEQKERLEVAKESNDLVQLKKYGDVLRNTVVKLGNDLIEVIPFFDNFERQASELKIPRGIRVPLLKPFLNDRARLLVNRIEGAHANDYDYVKEYLLQQFKLVPQYFLETFDTLYRQSHETYRAFVSRL